ncbi:hypothetical protein L3X38_003830 [Prunus dulcis]|uniref:Mediator of RNA polymerase II transcription subunit 7 n=1 Tax=Prunus dulcis TaxID=3755 RepID=A0AAD4ZMS4_PRUDU|nr:hypothetical protein L3X38_003830 [Prunus dulcis]
MVEGLWVSMNWVITRTHSHSLADTLHKNQTLHFVTESLGFVHLCLGLARRETITIREESGRYLIFKNLHHLLNSLRPHQARATLIHILELQIQRRKQAVEDIKKRREEARRLLKESIGMLEDIDASFVLK